MSAGRTSTSSYGRAEQQRQENLAMLQDFADSAESPCLVPIAATALHRASRSLGSAHRAHMQQQVRHRRSGQL